MYRVTMQLIVAAAALAFGQARVVRQVWNVRETLTDYYEPADRSRRSRDNIFASYKPGHMRMAMLANDSLPGPLLEAELGDDIEITVNNLAELETVDIHWHSMPQIGTPWADGAYMTSGCGIPPVSGRHTYKFNAQLPGTRFWHSHVQHQMEKGLFGAIVVHDPDDPYRSAYAEERTLVFHEWWADPDALQAGSPLRYHDFRVHLVNGVFGNGTAQFPHHRLDVETGTCYRLRLIAVMGEDVGYKMTVAGHSMDVIAVEGQYTERTPAASIAMYIGSRYDVILCADQEPGDYLVEFSSVQREEVLGLYGPVLRFGFVISYKGTHGASAKGGPSLPALPLPMPLSHLAGARDVHRGAPGPGIDIDVNKRPSAIKPLRRPQLPAATRAPITLWLGATISMDLKFWGFTEPKAPNAVPRSPLLFTKCGCGVAEDTRIIELPNNTVVDIVLNNLLDTVHPQHLHGNNFWVLGSGHGLRPQLSDSERLVLPVPGMCRRLGTEGAHYADPVIGDKTAPLPAQVWGCPFDNATDFASLNLGDPYETDTVIVPAHSWAVIRVHFANPGVWPFHCHKLYHMKAGMEMYFNVGPDVQPAIPADIPADCGGCPVANRSALLASSRGLAAAG